MEPHYGICHARVTKGYSSYVDSLTTNHCLRAASDDVYHIESGFLSLYFDFLVFAVIVVLTLIPGIAVKGSLIFGKLALRL